MRKRNYKVTLSPKTKFLLKVQAAARYQRALEQWAKKAPIQP